VPSNTAVRARIEEVGIIPSVRTSSADDARFAAESVFAAGINVVEIAMTVPDALQVVAELRDRLPGFIVGVDSAWDLDRARRAVDAGVSFVTSPGLDSRSILEFVIERDLVVIPGALTPTEVSTAWQAGADFVKVFPCGQFGGPGYIRALRHAFPTIPLIASGGVTQATAGDFMKSGALALGIGHELTPKEAITTRNRAWITELARRFLSIVKDTRAGRTTLGS
jgi:2-dehydro-3-deoxyphosphogluconate aldolase / (4S)-4-hydroxy-2-oxoglutarate aldolase